MYLNNFSVRVPEGTELAGAYVEMEHGTQYTLRLRNGYSFRRCDAQVKIDGKHIGTFRIGENDSITIERPVHDTGRFTFYKSGSREAKQSRLDSVSDLDLGLIEVVFTPEQLQPTITSTVTYGSTGAIRKGDISGDYSYYALSESDAPARRIATASIYTANSDLSSGGTGLSGLSTQNFQNAQNILYDYTLQTTIHLRLVTRKHDGRPRPLTQFSNPIPPMVGK